MFLDFLFFLFFLLWVDEKGEKKNIYIYICCLQNKERKVCFLKFFFYGSKMRKAGKKKKNELRMCLTKRVVAKSGLV